MYLSLRNICKRFGTVPALADVSLDVDEGEFVCFLGPSGCGKTTLLRIIAGLEKPDSARLLLGGRDLARIPARARNFGIVFQSYSLFPNLSVARNIAYGLACRGWTAAAQRARVDEMLAVVNLADHAGHYPHQLSGGQQQRVALARALAPRPQVLLLDEPLSALDAKVREDLRAEIKSLQSALGVTTIMVTHDQHEAMEIADRIVVMNRGVIEQIGAPRQLYDEPANRFVADFIGRMNFWSNGADGSVLGVRPEHLHLAADADAGDRAWRGRIERIVFLGSITRVLVAGDDRRCTVELGGSRPDLQVGQSVYVHADAAAVHHLAGPGA
jgi:ABC-type Fe3+/spermidine/putrescine transport system ATPase subunit